MEKYLDIFESLYGEIINEISSNLYENNKEYKDKVQKCVDIINEYPNVRAVCEDKQAIALSVEEVMGLIQYLDSFEDREEMKSKLLFYTGAKYFYLLMKNMDLLKE